MLRVKSYASRVPFSAAQIAVHRGYQRFVALSRASAGDAVRPASSRFWLTSVNIWGSIVMGWMTRAAMTAPLLALAMIGQAAQARLIDALPQGEPLSFAGEFQSRRLDDGRVTRDYDGFTFAAQPVTTTNNTFVLTSAPSANFFANGEWTGPLMLNSGGGRGILEFHFDVQQAAVLFEMNWVPGLSGVGDFEIAIFDANDNLLETANIAYSGATGFFGFGDRQTADIARLVVRGSSFGVRNMTVSDAVAGVPEPSTWAAMVLGFGMLGGAVRSGRARSPKLA